MFEPRSSPAIAATAGTAAPPSRRRASAARVEGEEVLETVVLAADPQRVRRERRALVGGDDGRDVAEPKLLKLADDILLREAQRDAPSSTRCSRLRSASPSEASSRCL